MYVYFRLYYIMIFNIFQNYYYFAIVEDLILRFGWTLSVSLTEMGLIHADIMSSVLAPLEVIRFVPTFVLLLSNCNIFNLVAYFVSLLKVRVQE